MKSIEEVMGMALECLNCKKPLCSIDGCPVKTDIPRVISFIKKSDFESAYYVLKENNIMSDICFLVCPVEQQCMGSCVRGSNGHAVRINELEKFVNEWAKKNNIEYTIKCSTKNNHKVAVIGGGVTGIACSVELAKKGFSVTIFEREKELGGVLKYGIPDFRLEKSLIDELVKILINLGVSIKTEIEFGTDTGLESLKADGYEAIFLGIGAAKSSAYKLSDDCSNGIYNADDILKKYNNGKMGEIGNLGTMAVIGGGNVAIDVARSSVRSGADKVYILYRRDLNSMPARAPEIEEIIKEGVQIIYLTKVIGCIYENDKISKVKCIKTKIVDGKLMDVENSEFELSVDNVVFAIGMVPDEEVLKSENLKLNDLWVAVDENLMTNIPGVFAGGDLVENKSSVCKAINMGKVAAENIEKYVIR